jgi:hypothetical protein
MMRNGFISFHIALLMLPTAVKAGIYDPIIEQIRPGNIVIIGETHQKPESPQFFKQLVDAAVAQYQCLSIGLEIERDQQAAIDEVMAGRSPVSKIKVPVVIDHDGMRWLIEQLADIKRHSPCLKVEAIDADHDRDENMADSLADFPTDKPILALLGGLHTLKKVDWTAKSGEPAVAEILVKRGFRVKSYPQRWLPEKCENEQGRTGRYVRADNSEALPILNDSLMSLINAKPHRSTRGVIDGFVVWECKRLLPPWK